MFSIRFGRIVNVSLVSAAAAVGLFSLTARATVYDANASFSANEQSGATQTNSSFGPFTVGWGNTIPADGGPSSAFTPFAPSEFTSAFAGNANTQGFETSNNVLVPAAAVNDLGSTAASGFSGLNPGEILLHPGGRSSNGFNPPIYNGVLEFVAPVTGLYTIAGNFRSLDIGSTVDEIGVNGTQVFAVTDPANSTQGTTYAFNFTQNLVAGDKVDFAVNDGADGIGNDSTGLTATLTVPEPASLAVLGMIGCGLLLRRRQA